MLSFQLDARTVAIVQDSMWNKWSVLGTEFGRAPRTSRTQLSVVYPRDHIAGVCEFRITTGPKSIVVLYNDATGGDQHTAPQHII